jgi:uncharacterized protein
MADYIDRLNDRLVAELMAGLPAVMLIGPRGGGKTTTARRFARTVVRLDRAAEAGPFRDDPDTVLASLDPPVLLDEWQAVPQVLGSVKRAIDDVPEPGRYLLTGSVRADLLAASWPATGRVVRVTHWGLTERELAGNTSAPSLFDILFAEGPLEVGSPARPCNLRDYVERALRGTYPEVATQPSKRLRSRWLGAYIDQLVSRDAAATLQDERRDPVRLRRYLTAVADNTAGVVSDKTLHDAAGIARLTGVAYDSLLELLFIIDPVPAWHSNRLNRLTRRPKRYLTDPALLGPLLGVDERSALRHADLLGRIVDTFVAAQLRPEVEVSEIQPRLHHLRLDDGSHEIDLVAEAPDGRVVAIEVKSSAAPETRDARHLEWLRDRLGDQFTRGVVFHTGPRPYALADRIYALPICSIWDRGQG